MLTNMTATLESGNFPFVEVMNLISASFWALFGSPAYGRWFVEIVESGVC